MAMKVVCSVFDSAAGLFGTPFTTPAVGSAIRSVRDEVGRQAPDNPLYQHPEDFELFLLAAFDDATGVLVPHDKPERVARCKDLVQV